MVACLGKINYLRKNLMVNTVVLNSLVICRLKMGDLVIFSFWRSSCDRLRFLLFTIMLFLHIVFFSIVVLVIVVPAFEFSYCMRIVMGLSRVLCMENRVLLELSWLHIIMIVILMSRLWFSDMSFGLLDVLLWLFMLRDGRFGRFVRSNFVVDTSWPFVNDRSMRRSLMLWLSRSFFWSRWL